MRLAAEPWFPSIVWNTTLDEIDNEELERYCLQLRSDSEGRKRSNSCNSFQSNDLPPNDNKEFDKLGRTITELINEASQSVGIGRLGISDIWANVNEKGGFNYPHVHPQSTLSGVYYVKAKPGQGGFKIDRDDDAQYYLPKNVSSPSYFNMTNWVYPSETGKILIFPSWLRHSVLENETDECRISISFNTVGVDHGS